MVTIFLWALVGGLAGLIFGVTAGLPMRIVAFVILLGAGAAAVPLVEAEIRNRRKGVRNVIPSRAGAPHPLPLLVKERGKTEEGVLSPAEARQWLDDFLVKQQEKPDSTRRV